MARNGTRPSYQLLIIDFLAFSFLGMLVGFIEMRSLTVFMGQSESLLLGLAIPTFLFLTVGIILYVIAEYKFNHLKIKNIFLYLGILIALANVIAISVLPNVVELHSYEGYEAAEPLVITPIMRIYYLLSGFAFALMPYFCLYLIPRKILNRRYMDIILYVLLAAVVGLILLSLIVEWKNYVEMVNHLTNIEDYALQSICGHKNVFAKMLLFGIFAAILLRIKKKDGRWILFFIPFYLFTLLTFSKITILVATLTIVTYFAIRLVMICKKNKDNLIITLLITGFILLLLPLPIYGIINSESGILFVIKTTFINLKENAATTFGSRLIIWRCAFDLLKPYQYIFGFGINSFGLAIFNTYAPVAKVLAPWEPMVSVYHAHNIFIEFIGRGGIILLGVYLFLYIYLIYIALKLRKKTPWLSTATIFFLFMSLIIGMVEPTYICGLDENLFMNLVMVFPIMSEYYLLLNKNEIEVKNEIVNQSKSIQKINFKNKLLQLNKKRLIYEAKYIAYDLNSKIKY